MICIYASTETDFSTHGEGVLRPNSAVITWTADEHYLTIEAGIEYADRLVQGAILAADTVMGRIRYRVQNPDTTGDTITVRAEYITGADTSGSGDVRLAQGINYSEIRITEGWDDVVTRLEAVYEDTIITTLTADITYDVPYNVRLELNVYPEHVEAVSGLTRQITQAETDDETLQSSVFALSAKKSGFTAAITETMEELERLRGKIAGLGDSETERIEKLALEAQLNLVEEQRNQYIADRDSVDGMIKQTIAAHLKKLEELEGYRTAKDKIVIHDVIEQAQAYLEEHKKPDIVYTINVDLYDRIRLEDPVILIFEGQQKELRVAAFNYDCIYGCYTSLDLGNRRKTLKDRFAEVEQEAAKTEEELNSLKNAVSLYDSEYRRTVKELYSRYSEELYGTNGMLGTIKKATSLIQQTAGSITLAVNQTLQDYSTTQEMVAAITLKANEINLSVKNTLKSYSTTEQMNSAIKIKADAITLEVNRTFESYSTTEQMNSAIKIKANAITLEVNKKFEGYSTSEQMTTAINIKAGEITATLNSRLSDYSTTTEMNTAITAKAGEITTSFSSTLRSYSTTSQMNTAISNSASGITATMTSKFTNYSTTTQMTTAINAKAGEISTRITNEINGVNTSISSVEQTANKISWLVKSGTSSSNFTLTDRAISLVASTITMTGYVKFTDLSSSGRTTIHGGNITTGTIDASKVSVVNLNANNINTGKIGLTLIYTDGGYRVMSANLSTLTIGGTSSSYVNNTVINGTSFMAGTTSAKIGKSGGTLGFFGGSGSSKGSISRLGTNATLSTVIGKVNELLRVLNDYGFITSS